MTKKINKNSIIMQGSILAMAGLIVRVIGLVYRIPLTRLLTSEGMGYYGDAFDVYLFFLMVSSYGFPTAISKLTSTMHAKKRYREAHTIFKSAMALSLLIGVIFSLILWFGAGTLAKIFGVINAEYAIRALSPALLCFSLLAVFRGYFQGMNNMVPTAVSQIFEQIFNAVFSILLAWMFVKKGLAYGAAGGTMGTGVGALAALAFMAFIYMVARNRVIHKRIRKDTKDYELKQMTAYWKVIIFTAVPIVLGTTILNLSSLIDTIMFQRALISKGLTQKQTAALYGIYSAKYKTLTRLPTTIAASISVASVPSLTASVTNNNKEELTTKVSMSLRMTLLIAFPAAVGEFVLAKPIIWMLFGTDDLEMASKVLMIGAISVVFLSLYTVSIGILQGLGKLKLQAFICLIALIVKVIINAIIFYGMNIGIYGAVIASVIFSILFAFLNMRAINKTVKIRLDIQKAIIIPIMSSILMGVVSYIIYKVIYMISLSNTMATLFAVIIAVLVYGIAMVVMKGISREELLRIPKGALVVKFFDKLGIL